MGAQVAGVLAGSLAFTYLYRNGDFQDIWTTMTSGNLTLPTKGPNGKQWDTSFALRPPVTDFLFAVGFVLIAAWVASISDEANKSMLAILVILWVALFIHTKGHPLTT